MATHTAGLSKNEREKLQDLGEVGRLDDSFRVYKHRIKNKIHPTLTDCILLIKYSKNMDLREYLKTECKEDLLTLMDEITSILTEGVSINSNALSDLLST